MVDILAVLIEQPDHQKARKYWNKLAQRLREEGSQSVTNCHHLKMQAKDGKYYQTDAANIETLLRIIQSVPSKKAEPIKLWLARVGSERIKEWRNFGTNTHHPDISQHLHIAPRLNYPHKLSAGCRY